MKPARSRRAFLPVSAFAAFVTAALGATAAGADPLQDELGRVIALHGWPCGTITRADPIAKDTYAAVCADGNRYEVFVSPRARDHAATRQTGLRSMLEVDAEMQRLESADPAERAAAARHLAAIGPHASPAISHLVRALSDPAPAVRSAAAEALGSIGANDAGTRRALDLAASDPDATVRSSAAAALRRLLGG
jgi:HEAT repeat protein